MRVKKLLIFIIPTLACLFNAAMVLYPNQVIAAAREGLLLWFNNVLPSLLPFMISVNILSSTGFVNFLGALLSPVMRPLFHVPGEGGFALITGLLSGYPMGAKVIGQLCNERRLTQTEAQRLIGFCNNAGPLFIVGVTGAGLFGSAASGYCLWLSHVLAALILGFALRFYRSEDYKVNGRTEKKNGRFRSNFHPNEKNIFWQSYKTMGSYRQANDVSIGRVLGESVKNAMESVTVVGGFIIFFCVIVKVLETCGAFEILRVFQGDGLLVNGLAVGLLEVTNGVKTLSQASKGIIPSERLIAAAGIIAFGGFSIHAQVFYFIRKTGIKAPFYLFCKLIHAVLAALLCMLLFPVFRPSLVPTAVTVATAYQSADGLLIRWVNNMGLCCVVTVVLTVIPHIKTPLKYKI